MPVPKAVITVIREWLVKADGQQAKVEFNPSVFLAPRGKMKAD